MLYRANQDEQVFLSVRKIRLIFKYLVLGVFIILRINAHKKIRFWKIKKSKILIKKGFYFEKHICIKKNKHDRLCKLC
jgi:phosphatidylserine synthase